MKATLSEDKLNELIDFHIEIKKVHQEEKILKRYETDPATFIDNECWVFNPDKSPSILRFKLYDYQREFVKKLYKKYLNQENILDEKTRQMGLSWLYMAFFLWGLLFDPGFSGFVMSYKEKLVDDGGSESTIDSLLGKLRFMNDYLGRDSESKIINEDISRLSQELHFKYLRVSNKKTGAYLVGSSANPNAGRGGSYRIGLWDETASTPKSEIIFPAFHQAVRCQCLNSTVRGKGNVFARLRHLPDSDYEVVTLHWALHPEKAEGMTWENGKPTSPWYEKQCLDLSPTQVAQEIDIDYEASVEGRVYDKFSRLVHVRTLDFNPDWKSSSIIAWDLGVSDETFGSVMQMDNQGSIGVIDEIVGTDEEISFYIGLICGVEPAELKFMSADRKKMYLDFLTRSRKFGYRDLIQVAGPDAVQRSITSKRSVRDQFLRAGSLGRDSQGKITDRRYRNLRMIPLTGYKIMDRIIAAKKLMNPQNNHLVISDRCVNLIERLLNYKWTKTTEGMNKESPEHDWASHGSDSFGYGILWYMKHRSVLRKPLLGETRSRGQRQGIISVMKVGTK